MDYKKLVPMGLFVLNSCKVLFFSPTVYDLGCLFVLGCVAAFYEFKMEDKKQQEMFNELEKHKIAIENTYKEIIEVRKNVAASKLTTVSPVKGNPGLRF